MEKVVSGPEIYLEGASGHRCRFCSHPESLSLEHMVVHYQNEHRFNVIERRQENGDPIVEMHKLEIQHIYDDQVNDSAVYRVEIRVTPRPKRYFEIRITLSSKGMAATDDNVESKIRQWFFIRPLPPNGEVVNIPQEHFDPRYF